MFIYNIHLYVLFVNIFQQKPCDSFSHIKKRLFSLFSLIFNFESICQHENSDLWQLASSTRYQQYPACYPDTPYLGRHSYNLSFSAVPELILIFHKHLRHLYLFWISLPFSVYCQAKKYIYHKKPHIFWDKVKSCFHMVF